MVITTFRWILIVVNEGFKDSYQAVRWTLVVLGIFILLEKISFLVSYSVYLYNMPTDPDDRIIKVDLFFFVVSRILYTFIVVALMSTSYFFHLHYAKMITQMQQVLSQAEV